MSILVTFFHVLVGTYRLIVALWNASVALLQVTRSVAQAAKQEAVELMALLDDGAPVMDAVTSTLYDADGPANPWPMLIIARASSFVLLLRLSKRRVLHLEVDETFITAKLEVIRSELVVHIQHVPRLLQMPIGMYDTRLVRYTPMKLPYLWREEEARWGGGGEVAEGAIVPAARASCASVGGEGRAHRKKCVQLLAESALRRRLHMDRLGRADVDSTPTRGVGVVKTHGGNAVQRKALVNATNAHAGGADAVGVSDEAGKAARAERHVHAGLSENASMPSLRKGQTRRMPVGSLRRKRGQFSLYAQGSEFSLVPRMA